MATQYVGPYSPQAYDAADIMQSGGVGTPYSPSILQAADQILASQPGQVLGDSTSSSGGSSSGGSSSPAPSGGGDMPQPQGPSQEEVDAIFNPQFDFLSQAEAALRGDQPSALQEAEAEYGQSLNELGVQKTQSEREVGSQETQATQRKESAMDAAARLYNELVMGGRQRFGGASSAGRAFGELSAREFQSQQGDIRTQYETASQQLAAARQKIEENYSMGKERLMLQMNAAKNQIRRDFQNKLLEIQRLRGEAESAKAQMRLEALQALRNQVFAIELQNAQFDRQLEMQRQSGMSTINTTTDSLNQQVGAATGATQQFGANTTTNPQTGLTIDTSQPRQATSFDVSPTGQISNQQNEDEFRRSLGFL